MNNKYSKFILSIIVVSFIVPQIVLASWYNPFSWRWNVFNLFNFRQPQTQVDKNSTQNQIPKTEAIVWKTYIDKKFGYQIQYPANAKISDKYIADVTGKEILRFIPVPSDPYNYLEIGVKTSNLYIPSIKYNPACLLDKLDYDFDKFINGNLKRSTKININGIEFKSGNIASYYEKIDSSKYSVTEYCMTNKDGALYSLVVVKNNNSIDLSLDKMVKSFKFIEPNKGPKIDDTGDSDCKIDSDCRTGHVCVDAKARESKMYQSCSTNSKNCQCLFACKSDLDCSPNSICNPMNGSNFTSGCTDQAKCDSYFKITKGTGACDLGVLIGGKCNSNQECRHGLTCRAGVCIDPLIKDDQNKKCSGLGDKSCSDGYQCVQDCGPPVFRVDEVPPVSYYCELNENVGKPKMCPICLAENTWIATPQGQVNVKNIKVGSVVWSLDKNGNKVKSSVMKISNTDAPKNHKVVDLILSDKREVWVSLNHPTINNKPVGNLKVGDFYDNEKVESVKIIDYWAEKTYDLLPDSETGAYWANGIILGSTLKL